MSLIDYITIIGNFDCGYIKTGLYSSGYFDMWNIGTHEITSSEEIKALIDQNRASVVDNEDDADEIIYEFMLCPSTGILNCPIPLVPGCELKLSFDRAKAELALIGSASTDSSVLTLKNLHLKAKYYSSPYLRTFFSKIDNNDINYRYDECSVYLKNLPQGETIVRLSNVIGGLTPRYIFCGVIESAALNGDFSLSSTRFQRHGVKELDLSLNGYSCNGFPIINNNGSAVPAYNKWLHSTNRFFNNKCAQQISPLDFKRFHFIYSHKFEGEPTEQGWIGLNIKLETAFTENYTLGNTKHGLILLKDFF